jgi:hypothetical protein
MSFRGLVEAVGISSYGYVAQFDTGDCHVASLLAMTVVVVGSYIE